MQGVRSKYRRVFLLLAPVGIQRNDKNNFLKFEQSRKVQAGERAPDFWIVGFVIIRSSDFVARLDEHSGLFMMYRRASDLK